MKMYTDKEFCELMRISRVTALRWREQRIVGFCKLPNGQVRYLQQHVDALIQSTQKEPAL